jgi:alpha-mannosidase
MGEQQKQKNKPRCYFIGNTHIDHTWLWNWTEGLDEVLASFRSALERMKEFPEFVFTCAVTLHYRWVEENDPAMFEEIKQRVAEGRWQIAGGWVVQSDNNIPCGEAFVRQGLYGQRYFASRFGKKARIGYCVDSFGHHAQLPQILQLQGMTGWLHFRPDGNEMSLPAGPYRWRGIDGTEVIACRPPGWYCTPNEHFFERCVQMMPSYLEAYPEVLFFYGVGDHGGGPTVRDLHWMRQFRAGHPELDCVYGNLDEFYERARTGAASVPYEALPVVAKELQHCFRGCYTTNGRLKSLNRLSEGRLLMAEKTAALSAMLHGAPYPRQELDRAWDHLLTNHFHDVICGTCRPDAMEEALFRYGGVLETADRVRHQAAKRLSAMFDRRPPKPFEKSYALCVMNSLSWDRREPVAFSAPTLGHPFNAVSLVDGEGRAVDFQRVEPPFGTPHHPKEFLFAPQIPAGGAAVFHLVAEPHRKSPQTDLQTTNTTLENRFWRVQVDPKTGTIRSLFDKRRGVELVRRGGRAAQLLVIKDLGDTWGTGRVRFGDVVGQFTPTEVRLRESGPLRARIEVRSEYGRCTANQRISLYRDFDFVDFDLEVMWNDKLKTVKIAFPFALSDARAFYEIPYGMVERPANGEEQPMQKWLMVRGRVSQEGGATTPYAVGIVADSIGGTDILAQKKGTEIRLTLLRSPYYGYLTHADAVEDAQRPVSDQGLRRVRYRLVGGTRDLGLPEHGESLSQPLQITFEGSQPGALTQPVSFFRCEPTTVHLTALKMAEDGDGFIVRLLETRGRATKAVVVGAGDLHLQTTLRPFEIQTWRWRKGAAPVLCNLLEEPMR